MILALRTDKPEAALYLTKADKVIDSTIWQAHRELSNTLLSAIKAILTNNSVNKSDLAGLVVYQGPGSFTGLRIGITVANTLAYSLDIPIVAAQGEAWLTEGISALASQPGYGASVLPHYGSEVHITQPRK